MNLPLRYFRLNSASHYSRSLRLLLLLFLAAFGVAAQTQPQQQTPAPATPGQQPESAPQGIQKSPSKIAVQVKTVSLLATVRDKHGKIISDLKKDDFVLEDDGHPQTINYFARETDAALRLGLLVDTSLSQRKVLDQERTASYSFLDHLLREDKDLAFLIHFDKEVELLQDFTPRPKLQAALQTLQTPQFDNNRGGNTGGGGSGGGGADSGSGGGYGGHGSHQRGGGGTHLYDAIYLASDELMSKQQGRKALIILSDGVDRGSKETLTEAIESAQRADTVIYSILFKDDEGNGPYGGGMMGPRGPYGGGGHHGGGRYPQQERPDGKKILEQISKTTGGRLFQASKKETVDKIYAEIEEELRNQYSLTYTPDKDTGAGYHKIQLSTKDKDLTVQTRDGYYSNQ